MFKASLYAKYGNVQRKITDNIVKKCIPMMKLQENAKILDVGAGDGTSSKEILMPLFPDFEKFICSDISKQMLDFAEKNIQNPKCEFSILDISTENVPEEFIDHFDHIIALNSLHWVPEHRQEQAIRNISAMLKPGGSVFLFIVISAPIYDTYRKLAQDTKWANYMNNYKDYISPYYYAHDPIEKLNKLLKKNQLHANLYYLEKVSHVYDDWDSCLNFAVSVNIFLKIIPEHEHENFLQDFGNEIKIIICESQNEKNVYQMRYEILVVNAFKL